MGYFIIFLLALALIGTGYFFQRKRRSRAARRSTAKPANRVRLFRGLQFRMTLSYVWITIALLLIIFAIVGSIGLSLIKPDTASEDVTVVSDTARQYATEVAIQAQGMALGQVFPYPLGSQSENINPDAYTDTQASTFLRNSHTVPYLSRLYPDSQPITFALLIAPNLRILSSSYPSRYQIGSFVNTLLPAQTLRIQNALKGTDDEGTSGTPAGIMIYATATIWSQSSQPIGAIYVQVPSSTLHYNIPGPSDYFKGTLTFIATLLVVVAPLGGIFGFIATRGLIKRLKNLALATTLVADGNYQHRLPIKRRDELGQLEGQFNRMAEQLGESTTRQKELDEENARLAERSRISRELHDAISQDLFSLSMLAGGMQSALPEDSPLQHQAGKLEQTTSTMIREMRALLLELRPTSLETLSLTEALEELATAYSTRLGIVVNTNLKPTQFDARSEHALLRIAQEALSNAARHANATVITLTLVPDGKMARLSIRDNGRGFQMSDESLKRGLGLRLMQERVQELGGTLQADSAPSQGTTLEIYLPLEE